MQTLSLILSFTFHVGHYLGGFHGYPSKLLGKPSFVSHLVILVGMSDGVERRWESGTVGLREFLKGGPVFVKGFHQWYR